MITNICLLRIKLKIVHLEFSFSGSSSFSLDSFGLVVFPQAQLQILSSWAFSRFANTEY